MRRRYADTILNFGRGLAELGVVSLYLLLTLTPAIAVQPDEILGDTALEARARAISSGLRCLVCQNQSIDDSDAPLAKDLRLLVRERLKAGDSDQAVESYIVARYGEFVLLKPPFGWHTLVLWLLPALALIGAIFAAMQSFGARTSPAKALSPEEEARLAEIEGHNT